MDNHFQQALNNYDELWKNEWGFIHGFGPSVRTRNRILLRLVKKYIKKGRVLDAGCGDGTFLELLYKTYEHDLEYEASESSPKALELTKKKQFINNTYLSDLESMNGFGKNEYNAVISSEVLEHIYNWKAALHNLARIVKPNNYLFITVPHAMKYWGVNDEFAGHFRRFEKGEIEYELKNLGFSINESIYWGFPTYWLYYSLFLNKFDPAKTMRKKHISLKLFLSRILYAIFHIDDLFNNIFGRRIFIVAQKTK